MDVQNFSALVPVRPGHERHLRQAVAALPGGAESPFAAVGGTHVARLVVLEAFGGPAEPRRRLRPALLALSAMIDGAPEAWLPRMCTVLETRDVRLWEHCAGWPGAGPALTAHWLRGFRIRMHVTIIGNADASVDAVEEGLRQRARLLELALEARHLTPAELRHRYATELRGHHNTEVRV